MSLLHIHSDGNVRRRGALLRLASLSSGRILFPLVVLIPTVAFYATFVYIPIFASIAMSFSNVDIFLNFQNAGLVGVGNYRKALADPLTWTCLRNTFVFTILTVPAGTLLALALAVLLNTIQRGRILFRTFYFLPVVTSMVAVSLMWRWLYQPRFGLLNVLIEAAGHLAGAEFPLPRWLEDPRLALVSIAIMSTWKRLGFDTVILVAGLSGLPTEFLDAARIDGATRRQLFTKMTLPLLRPTLAFVLVTHTISALQVFTQVFIMTDGGPLESTNTIVLHIYRRAFLDFLGGYTSTLAVILFVIILIVSLFQLRLYRTTWEY